MLDDLLQATATSLPDKLMFSVIGGGMYTMQTTLSVQLLYYYLAATCAGMGDSLA